MQLRFEAHYRGRTEVVGWIFSWKPKGLVCWSSRRTRLHISVRFGIHCAASHVTNWRPRVEQPMSDLLNAQGRPDSRGGLLFLVSHQNLNPSYWCIWRTKNPQKRIRIKKVRGPQSRGDQELKKTNHLTLQNLISIIQKIPCMFLWY
jgi:hypothetical protein